MALAATTLLFAQSFDNDACYMEETEEGIQYVQRFEWQHIDYIQKFMFYLEKQDAESGIWEEIDCIETQDNHLELPLDSGAYRYKIVVYNLLGQAELESDWIQIDITKVYEPEIKSILEPTIYLDQQRTDFITIKGTGLFDVESIVFKNESKAKEEKSDDIEVGKIFDVSDIQTDEKGSEVIFHLDNPEELFAGEYKIYLTNEGGLSTVSPPLTVRFSKRFDLDISLGYTCLVNVFDSNFLDFFGGRVWPLSASAKINAMFIKGKWGYLGLGVTGTYTMLQNFVMPEVTEGYKLSGSIIHGYADIVYQKPLRRESDNKLMFIFEGHAGAGLVMLNDITFHFPHNIATDPFNVLYLSANVGGAVQFYITKHLYTEFNCDCTITPSVDMTMINVLPSINIGWQF